MKLLFGIVVAAAVVVTPSRRHHRLRCVILFVVLVVFLDLAIAAAADVVMHIVLIIGGKPIAVTRSTRLAALAAAEMIKVTISDEADAPKKGKSKKPTMDEDGDLI